MKHLGVTRSSRRYDHLLQTPDTFVRTPFPSICNGVAIVHCSPALGARFAQYTVELEANGTLVGEGRQRFLYVIEGAAQLTSSAGEHSMSRGAYAYVPAALEHRVTAGSSVRIAVIEKPYDPVSGLQHPALLLIHESDRVSEPLMGDSDLRVCSLLPSDPAFDFAVNTMTYQPGASLSMVEVHVMEHGLLMLEGEGIYRLSDCWYPVQAGDFIWMRAFCPQWFGALGKKPAKYLIYKDWNRSPLSAPSHADLR